MQAECIHNLQIGSCSVARFDDDAEAAAVFPHGPADVVALERGADVADPLRTHGRIGIEPVRAKFSTPHGYVMHRAPLGGETNIRSHADAVRSRPYSFR